MTFEEILPGLKSKKKYVRTGWGGAENYVQLFDCDFLKCIFS